MAKDDTCVCQKSGSSACRHVMAEEQVAKEGCAPLASLWTCSACMQVRCALTLGPSGSFVLYRSFAREMTVRSRVSSSVRCCRQLHTKSDELLSVPERWPMRSTRCFRLGMRGSCGMSHMSRCTTGRWGACIHHSTSAFFAHLGKGAPGSSCKAALIVLPFQLQTPCG